MTDDKSYPKTINPEYIALEGIWAGSSSFEEYRWNHPSGGKPAHNTNGKEIKWDELERTVWSIDRNWARQYLVFNELEAGRDEPNFMPSTRPEQKFRDLFVMHLEWEILERLRALWETDYKGSYLLIGFQTVCPLSGHAHPSWLRMALHKRINDVVSGKFESLNEAFGVRHLGQTTNSKPI